MINLDFEVPLIVRQTHINWTMFCFFINMNLGIQQFAINGIPITSIVKFRSVLLTSIVCFFLKKKYYLKPEI